jgi:serine O-acetyltransferase
MEIQPDFLKKILAQNQEYAHRLPSKADAAAFLDTAFRFLFTFNRDCETLRETTVRANYLSLFEQLVRLLEPFKDGLLHSPEKIATHFFTDLPKIYDKLLLDAQATLDNDPAAQSFEEVITVYPGFFAITIHRLANGLLKHEVPLLPRLFAEHAHSVTGIDIHPGATIGESFFIDHGTGVVIGETCLIGNHVKIYQGVTLGASHVARSLSGKKRHPTIEDHVVVYANATILGGKTVIGHNSVIGGNVWLTKSVEPHSLVYHQSEIQVKNQFVAEYVIDFVI